LAKVLFSNFSVEATSGNTCICRVFIMVQKYRLKLNE
jgi:hypothetical protein